MNMVEGFGLKPPGRIQLAIGDGDLECVVREANRRAALRNYHHSSGTWKNGLTGKRVLPDGTIIEPHVVPILSGLVGEYAVAHCINRRFDRELCRIDLTLKRDGDGGIDLSPLGYGLDVKTRTKDYGSNLIRCRKDNGEPVEFKCRAFVFCEWAESTSCDIIGWATCRKIRSLPEVAARRGEHMNHELPDCGLEPFTSLVDLLKGLA